MHIVYISDGKAGHRSQALGLFTAIQQQKSAADFQEINVEQLSLLSLIKASFSQSLPVLHNQPDIIIGVGSHTHLWVWLLAQVFPKAKTIILMKPNLPLFLFDYAIIPEHDGVAASNRVIITQGVLNPLINEHRHEPNRVLIALGGTSKRHQWNEETVLTAIKKIIQQEAHATIILTTSRRTPEHFLTHLKKLSGVEKLQIFPVEQTPQGWIFEQMQLAETIWVTEDSVSMIFEALTAGCRVGVITIDRRKSDRITQMIDQLPFEQEIGVMRVLQNSAPLNEASRVASQILASSSF